MAICDFGVIPRDHLQIECYSEVRHETVSAQFIHSTDSQQPAFVYIRPKCRFFAFTLVLEVWICYKHFAYFDSLFYSVLAKLLQELNINEATFRCCLIQLCNVWTVAIC